MDDELVDIVDESGAVLRPALKRDAHKHGWLHRTVIAYVKHGADWGLVCQASDKQDAGQWVAPVGGHVRAGETDLEALTREVEEEIGVKHFDHKRIGIARFHRQVIGRDENHLFVVYEISTSDPDHAKPGGRRLQNVHHRRTVPDLPGRPRVLWRRAPLCL